jgi:hypothetical protein
MERGRACVERNRSERSKVANVAEWKPPAPLRAPRSRGTPAGYTEGHEEPCANHNREGQSRSAMSQKTFST